MDLLENFEALPIEVQNLINSFGDDFTYDKCDSLLIALSPLGYTFEYGLDAQPYNLTKIPTVDGLKFDDVVTDYNGHQWTQICTEHIEKLSEENKRISDGQGICGVVGCAKESEYYLDF
jgi:hypothetical protein